MIVSLLMTMEKAAPGMSRLVNVENSMHLGELSQVIDAAFGFSGAATHLFMGPARPDGSREVLSATPGLGERAEYDVAVAHIEEITYVYDPSANWNIHVQVLGHSQLDGPTPLLIDALGPDVVEACSGPAMMSRFHAEARRITAGLPPDMEVAPLLLSFLPVMSPERLLQRLSQADAVTVSERIGFVAEDLFLDTADGTRPDPRAPQFAAEFEDFLNSRPDLREILEVDPAPERNPTLVAAMTEFFEDVMEHPREDPVREALCVPVWEVLAQPRQRVKLTSTGVFPPAHVVSIARDLRIPTPSPHPRETSVPDIGLLREVLTAAGFLYEEGGWLRVSTDGEWLVDDPDGIHTQSQRISQAFASVLGAAEWRAALEWFFDQDRPAPSASHVSLLRTLGAVTDTPDGRTHPTFSGAHFAAVMLAHA